MPSQPLPTLSAASAAALVFAALAGASGVALAAWAAHGAVEPAKSWLTTASTVQLLHAAAMVASLALQGRLAGWARRLAGGALAAFAIGILLFCGALTALAFGLRLGGLAPVGGLALIGGWLALAAAGLAVLTARRT
ncbi:MAG: DUF423 domain-containing protein [Alphaproteobacteria bacterium]